MTKTETRPTAEQLHGAIAERRAEIADLERQIGAAHLDGKDTKNLTRRANEAKSWIEATEAALAELADREAAEAEEARVGAASAQRREIYEWAAEDAHLCIGVLEAKAALHAAEDRLIAHRDDSTGARKLMWYRREWQMAHEAHVDSDLDSDIVVAVPPALPHDREVRKLRRAGSLLHEKVTVESMQALAALATERAEEERDGRGVDRCGIPSSGEIAVRERRRQRREDHERAKAERAEREAQERARRRAEAAAPATDDNTIAEAA